MIGPLAARAALDLRGKIFEAGDQDGLQPPSLHASTRALYLAEFSLCRALIVTMHSNGQERDGREQSERSASSPGGGAVVRMKGEWGFDLCLRFYLKHHL